MSCQTNQMLSHASASPVSASASPVSASASTHLERDAMKFEYTRGGRLVTLEVEVVRNSETRVVEGVIAVELVAAVCELPMEAATNALTNALKTNKHLNQVQVLKASEPSRTYASIIGNEHQ